MREIKFRAWNTDNSKMVYPIKPHQTLIDNCGCMVILESVPVKGGTYELRIKEMFNGEIMEYSGLKGLYESDIILDTVGKGIIEYVEKYAAFRVNYIGESYCKWFYDYLDSELNSIEIIGNIYENRELLK